MSEQVSLHQLWMRTRDELVGYLHRPTLSRDPRGMDFDRIDDMLDQLEDLTIRIRASRRSARNAKLRELESALAASFPDRDLGG